MNLFGKHLLTTQEWSVSEIEAVLGLADEMKKDRFSSKYTSLLLHKTFFMFFYNPSVRTRQSFECAATELGGHAQFLEPSSMRLKTSKSAGETNEDAAKVMSRYACGLGIRMLEDKVQKYGDGDAFLREYCQYGAIPVLSMAHDKYHPCQGFADVQGAREHLGGISGKKLLMVWGHGALARSWCSVQESILINSRLGMNVTLAYPKGYDLDPEVIANCKKNCQAAGTKFEITNDPVECYRGADIVYSRNWMSPHAYDPVEGFQKKREVEAALKHAEWITDSKKMAVTNNALYTHPMPVDRGHEVSDEVCSGPRSIIYDVAENRLHVQKAIMALTMSKFDYKPSGKSASKKHGVAA
ncbi:MAG: ornithine carbamoyltransferase [Elusimicrobia bacterium]|nr:ornithine carbamoyltransferase [Elusimicrobiota bacterium]